MPLHVYSIRTHLFVARLSRLLPSLKKDAEHRCQLLYRSQTTWSLYIKSGISLELYFPSLVFSLFHLLSSLFLRILLSGSCLRGHCVVAGSLFLPSAKDETCLAGSDKKEIKSWGLSLSCRKSAISGTCLEVMCIFRFILVLKWYATNVQRFYSVSTTNMTNVFSLLPVGLLFYSVCQLICFHTMRQEQFKRCDLYFK